MSKNSRKRDLKRIESNVYAPQHSYNTRLSAKFTTSNCCLLFTPNSSLSNYKETPENNSINECEDYLDDVSNLSDASYLLPSYPCVDIDIFKNKMRVRQHPASSCNPPYGCTPPSNRLKQAFIFLVSIALFVLTMFYINEKYNKSCDTMSLVTSQVNNIKKQVDGMKVDVSNVIKVKDSTEQKLSVIECMLKEMQTTQNDRSTTTKCDSLEPCKSVVQEMLDEYDADKTGKTDFALESAGGTVISTLDTENFLGASNTLTLFGVPLCESSNNPRAIIQPGMSPGQCWAFKGSRGQALIKLLTSVKINGVTLEHISKSISPSGEITTAPKDFSIWGVADPNAKQEKLLGQFTYDINKASLQYFPITDKTIPYQYIIFKVHTNHGNSDFTCVYRLRVHGDT